MPIFAQAGLTVGEVIAIATTIVVAMAGAVAFIAKAFIDLVKTWITQGAEREKSHEAHSSEREKAHEATMKQVRDECAAERKADAARYDRLIEARAEDAEKYRGSIAGLFAQSARAVENAAAAVELMATNPTPDPSSPPQRGDRITLPSVPEPSPSRRGGRRA